MQFLHHFYMRRKDGVSAIAKCDRLVIGMKIIQES
jgi:hypothetical protein